MDEQWPVCAFDTSGWVLGSESASVRCGVGLQLAVEERQPPYTGVCQGCVRGIGWVYQGCIRGVGGVQ